MLLCHMLTYQKTSKKITRKLGLLFQGRQEVLPALLRLTIEKLTNTILEENKNKSLNSKIELLVEKKVLRSEIGKALHVVRVIGNNAVPNPAEIDLRDDIEIAVKLFKLVNMIVQETITESREIDSIIHNLPNGAKKSIEKRNGNMVPKGNQLDE